MTKIVDNFSSELMIVYIDYNDQVRLELNVPFLSRTTDAHAASVSWEDLMPRFYFDLASNDEHMIDAGRKDLGTLNDAYDYAPKLIDKILFHVGDNDADTWKVIISNDEHDAQMIALYFDALNDHAACEESEAVLFFAGWRSLRPCEQTLCSHVMRF